MQIKRVFMAHLHNFQNILNKVNNPNKDLIIKMFGSKFLII